MDVTSLLAEAQGGDSKAAGQLIPLVYDELRRLAAHYMRGERPDHTLQATALVHEAYLRLVDQSRVSFQNRAHFFGVAANLMRRILVDHARGLQAAKRGSGQKLPLDEAMDFGQQQEVDLVTLDDALERLAQLDRQQSRIVELRFFSGLGIEETAEALGISPATVKRDWTVAKAWLYQQVTAAGP